MAEDGDVSGAGQWETECCWLREPVRPCVFWVITGFGIHSAGRGHAVETNVLEPALSLGPDTPPPPLLHRPHGSFPISPPPPVTVCVPTCPGQTTPSEEFTLSPHPFISSFFLASWPSCFCTVFCLTLQTLLLPHTRLYVTVLSHNRPRCMPLWENSRCCFTLFRLQD